MGMNSLSIVLKENVIQDVFVLLDQDDDFQISDMFGAACSKTRVSSV
jgi:hypothetical protein